METPFSQGCSRNLPHPSAALPRTSPAALCFARIGMGSCVGLVGTNPTGAWGGDPLCPGRKAAIPLFPLPDPCTFDFNFFFFFTFFFRTMAQPLSPSINLRATAMAINNLSPPY